MLRRGAPGALAATKELLRRDRRRPRWTTGSPRCRSCRPRFFAAAEAQEGMAAFAAKRPPSWAPPERVSRR